MAYRTKTYKPPKLITLLIGATVQQGQIIDTDLALNTIIRVKREGIGYNIIYSGTPGSREVYYSESLGLLIFKEKFDGTETVSVMIKN